MQTKREEEADIFFKHSFIMGTMWLACDQSNYFLPQPLGPQRELLSHGSYAENIESHK